MSKLAVTQRRSKNGCDKRQLDTLRSLGLRRIGQTVEVNDSPQIRGMIHKVRHLVEVGESGGADSAKSAGADSAKSAAADSVASSAVAHPGKGGNG